MSDVAPGQHIPTAMRRLIGEATRALTSARNVQTKATADLAKAELDIAEQQQALREFHALLSTYPTEPEPAVVPESPETLAADHADTEAADTSGGS